MTILETLLKAVDLVTGSRKTIAALKAKVNELESELLKNQANDADLQSKADAAASRAAALESEVAALESAADALNAACFENPEIPLIGPADLEPAPAVEAAPVEVAPEAVVEAPVETPAEAPAEAPAEVAPEVPVEVAVEPAPEAPVAPEAPTDLPVAPETPAA